ncbi:glycosyltransferase family 2 protein [Psychroserpens sp. MEBiC05023]
MISVLIPVYNYDVKTLVKTIHNQLELCHIPFEIRCLDDASEVSFQKQKTIIEGFSNTFYYISERNHGRIITRQLLAKSALYDNILFLDADVIPKEHAFISNYLTFINSKYDAVYGGVTYTNETPKKEYKLRWAYGKLRENVPAETRNKLPYKNIVSANFFIKKAVFLTLNNQIEHKGYGSDNYFSIILKRAGVSVLHIDNFVYHLGIETSTTYLKKQEEAIITLLRLHQSQNTELHDNQLLKVFARLKRFGFNYLISWFYPLGHHIIKKNLLGSNPSVTMLQMYRLGYMCYKDLNP